MTGSLRLSSYVPSITVMNATRLVVVRRVRPASRLLSSRNTGLTGHGFGSLSRKRPGERTSWHTSEPLLISSSSLMCGTGTGPDRKPATSVRSFVQSTADENQLQSLSLLDTLIDVHRAHERQWRMHVETASFQVLAAHASRENEPESPSHEFVASVMRQYPGRACCSHCWVAERGCWSRGLVCPRETLTSAIREAPAHRTESNISSCYNLEWTTCSCF